MDQLSYRVRTSIALSTLCLIGFLPVAVRAEVVPNALFGDHAVFQQGITIPVWGTADRGEAITVTLGEEQKRTKADGQGAWSVIFSARTAGGPHKLVIAGTNRITIENVMIGEVWVCSGQSNMEWPVNRSNKPNTEIAAANWPEIRLFSVKRTVAGEPESNVEGAWSELAGNDPRVFGGRILFRA